MKYIICLLFILLFSAKPSGQERIIRVAKSTTFYKYSEVYKWEAYTEKGAIIFGVSKSLKQADSIIADFSRRNANTSAKPLHHYIQKSVATSPDYFETFESYCPNGYRILLTPDVAALRIFEIQNLAAAAAYYDKYSSKKNYGDCMLYMSNLYNNFKPYRIELK